MTYGVRLLRSTCLHHATAGAKRYLVYSKAAGMASSRRVLTDFTLAKTVWHKLVHTTYWHKLVKTEMKIILLATVLLSICQVYIQLPNKTQDAL